ncbi:MAG TPA: hypothetical protein VGR84_18990 [Candidatus Acidoferrales bacterium]|nr:hypothetical protein [Candidatus Acidoferrales bacterium]
MPVNSHFPVQRDAAHSSVRENEIRFFAARSFDDERRLRQGAANLSFWNCPRLRASLASLNFVALARTWARALSGSLQYLARLYALRFSTGTRWFFDFQKHGREQYSARWCALTNSFLQMAQIAVSRFADGGIAFLRHCVSPVYLADLKGVKHP